MRRPVVFNQTQSWLVTQRAVCIDAQRHRFEEGEILNEALWGSRDRIVGCAVVLMRIRWRTCERLSSNHIATSERAGGMVQGLSKADQPCAISDNSRSVETESEKC